MVESIHLSPEWNAPAHFTHILASSSPLLPRQALLLPCLIITFRKPFARLDQLHHVQNLLCRHHRERDGRKYPRPGRIHLVCSGQFHGPCATGCSKKCGSWMRWTAGLRRRARGCIGGEKGGGQDGRGEGKEVEGYEEEFVEGADRE